MFALLNSESNLILTTEMKFKIFPGLDVQISWLKITRIPIVRHDCC